MVILRDIFQSSSIVCFNLYSCCVIKVMLFLKLIVLKRDFVIFLNVFKLTLERMWNKNLKIYTGSLWNFDLSKLLFVPNFNVIVFHKKDVVESDFWRFLNLLWNNFEIYLI